MGNSINNLRNNSASGRDVSSNHLENNGASSSRVPKPPFLPREEPSMEGEGQTTNNAIDNARAYASLEPEIRELVTFREFCEANRQETPRKGRRLQNQDLKSKINKVTLPNFDGSEKTTARAWLQKLNTYFTFSPMMEEDALQFAILHLEGTAHDWWHHGLITQGHQNVTSYEEFSQKLIKIFDRRYPQENFKKLAQIS